MRFIVGGLDVVVGRTNSSASAFSVLAKEHKS